MMKKQVLGFQPASRLENVDNEDPQHVQDRKHRPDDAMILAQAANPDGSNFRKGQVTGEREMSVTLRN